MKIIKIAETSSTNSWVAKYIADPYIPFDTTFMAYAQRQTSGRGQRGNSWEAQPDKNLTASFFFPNPGDFFRDSSPIPVRQFAISQAIALSAVSLLDSLGINAKIKWPNDIYVDDKKIGGILIEHSILGNDIKHTIAGVGLNINQQEFLSDAPNPVSLANLTGKEYDIDSIAVKFSRIVEGNFNPFLSDDVNHNRFMELLWRGDGNLHPFLDKKTGQRFLARIESVKPNGLLELVTTENQHKEYAFKEVEFIIEKG